VKGQIQIGCVVGLLPKHIDVTYTHYGIMSIADTITVRRW